MKIYKYIDEILLDKNNCNSFITFSGIKFNYEVFIDINEYLLIKDTYIKRGIDPYWHEVILPRKPHKFFIDLDYKTENTNDSKQRFDIMTRIAKMAILVSCKRLYKIGITDQDLAIIESSGETNNGYKFSRNIILYRYAVVNQLEHKRLGKYVLDIFNNEIKSNGFTISDKIFDQNQINKVGCYNNRLPGNTKYINGISEKRFKIWNNNLYSEKDLILTNTSNCVLLGSNSIEQNIFKKEIYIDNKLIEYALDISKKYWKGYFKYREIDENKIYFTRIKRSFCSCCKRYHDNDNTLYISISNSKKYINVKCIRDTSYIIKYYVVPSKLLNTTTITTTTDINNNDDSDDVNYVYDNYLKVDKDKGYSFTEHTKEITFDKAFKNNNNIKFIKAAMKMKKSTNCIKYIKLLEEVNPNIRIMLISFRRTFSHEAKRTYPNFEHYSDIKETYISLDDYPKLIIQLESLYRMDIYSTNKTKMNNNAVDLIILDEVESIWSQFSSGNFSDYSSVINNFKWLIENSNEIILMDAHLSNRTKRLMKILRPNDIPYIYENTYNPSRNFNYYFEQEPDWISQLGEDIKYRLNIIVFTNTIKKAKKLFQFAKLLGVNEDEIIVYSSETSETIKKLHFSDVNKYWSQYKVIICTPTVTAGVSFTENHFHKVYGYFVDLSCNVFTCMQMIGRVRSIINKEIIICNVKVNNIFYETNMLNIETNLRNNRAKLVAELGRNNNIGTLNYELQKDASIKYNKTFNYWLIIENIAYNNYSRNNFDKIYQETIENLDHNIIQLDIDKDIINLYKEKLNLSSEKAINIEYEKVNNAEIISLKEFNEIKNKMKRSLNVEEKEIIEYKKYKMLSTIINYDYNSKLFDPDKKINLSKKLVNKFYNSGYNLIKFANTAELFNCHPFNWDESIKNIYNKELNILDKTYNNNSNIEYGKRNYKSDCHRRIKEIIEAFPFREENINISDILCGCYIGKNQQCCKAEDNHDELDKFYDLIEIHWKVLFQIKKKIKRTYEKNEYFELLCETIDKFYIVKYSKSNGEPKLEASPYIIFMKDNKYIYKGSYRNDKQIKNIKKKGYNYPIINIT